MLRPVKLYQSKVFNEKNLAIFILVGNKYIHSLEKTTWGNFYHVELL